MDSVSDGLPLAGKTVLLGVSGGIAAYKAADYCRRLKKLGARVVVAMTEHAVEFVSPLTFSALSGEKVYTDLFSLEDAQTIPHIRLAKDADIFVIIPATANIIAKAACGIGDDLLSTLILAYPGPIIFAPSMNSVMYESVATQENMERLSERGHFMVEPGFGQMACGDVGRGRLAEWPEIEEAIFRSITSQTLKGRKVLVTAGPTREPLDPVRFISNRSSGKMGFSVAAAASRRGADVTLVSGPVSLPPPPGVCLKRVESAEDMAREVLGSADEFDVIVMTAAVADYAPVSVSPQKIKKGADEISIELKKTTDILSVLGKKKKKGQLVVGFCAETKDLVQNAKKKLSSKQADLIVANDVSASDSGFDVSTNRVTLIYRDGSVEELPLLPKTAVAGKLWDRIETMLIKHD